MDQSISQNNNSDGENIHLSKIPKRKLSERYAKGTEDNSLKTRDLKPVRTSVNHDNRGLETESQESSMVFHDNNENQMIDLIYQDLEVQKA